MFDHIDLLRFEEGQEPLLIKQMRLLNAFYSFIDQKTEEAALAFISASEKDTIEEAYELIQQIDSQISKIIKQDQTTKQSDKNLSALWILLQIPRDLWTNLSLAAAYYYIGTFKSLNEAREELMIYRANMYGALSIASKEGFEAAKEYSRNLISIITQASQENKEIIGRTLNIREELEKMKLIPLQGF